MVSVPREELSLALTLAGCTLLAVWSLVALTETIQAGNLLAAFGWLPAWLVGLIYGQAACEALFGGSAE